MTQYGLEENEIAAIKNILAQHEEVEQAILYGSRAKGNFKPASDIDLVLKGEKLTVAIQNRIADELDNLLLPYKFDLSVFHQISNADLLDHIGRVGAIFYGNFPEKEPQMEFIECTLDEIADIYNYRRVPLNSREREQKKGPYPYYGASGIVDHIDEYLFDGEYVLISEDGENLRSRNTPIAFKAMGKFWVNNHAHILKQKEDLLNDYIVYYFRNIDINPYVTGAAQPKLNKENLLSIPIRIPKNKILRNKLVLILKHLDDRIELNHQTNRTLEEIAKTLFQEMCMPKGDELPEGWRIGKLGDVCRNVRIAVNPQTIEANTPYVGLEHIPRRSLSLDEYGISNDVSSQKLTFRKYDILFGKLRPYFHKVCIAPTAGICSTDILVIEPIDSEYFSFCLNHLFSDELIKYVSSIADGTRMPRVDWKSVSDYEILIPDTDVIRGLNEICFKMYEKMTASSKENLTLSLLRDHLLPRLINGSLELL